MKIFITAILFLFSCRLSFCQWSTNPAINNAICTNYYPQNSLRIISDGSGGSIIAWIDSRSQPNYTIYAQRINSNGINQWTADGVLVSSSSISSYGPPAMVSDGNGGAIIVYVTGNDIYVQHINSGGLLQWGTNGVTICLSTAYTEQPQLTSDGSGGAIIAWSDTRNDVGNSNTDIYGQRINSSGTIQWPFNGIAIANTSNGEASPVITGDGSGGAIIAYSNSAGEIYSQKINAAGAMQWTANGVLVNSIPEGSLYPQLIPDAGGVIICWVDRRNAGTGWDIYIQKLNAGGSIQWTANGLPVCMANGNQTQPQLINDAAGGAIVTWDEPTSGTIPNPNIYAQRVSASGSVLWSANGVDVCLAASGQRFPQIISDGSGGAVITWQDARTNNIQDIYAQRINANGLSLWTNDGVAVSIATSVQRYPVIINADSDGAIIGWTDLRNDLTGQRDDIYAQRLNNNGTLGDILLPVTLTNIKAFQKNTGVQIEWTAQQASNIDRYEVERSANGRQFSMLGNVHVTGNSSIAIKYNLFDPFPFSGVNFYRIKIIEAGKETYSQILKVNMNNGSKNNINVYPNPIKGNAIGLEINLQKGNYTLIVTNTFGQQVMNKKITHAGGATTETLEFSKALAAGVYQLRLTGEGVDMTRQIIKN